MAAKMMAAADLAVKRRTDLRGDMKHPHPASPLKGEETLRGKPLLFKRKETWNCFSSPSLSAPLTSPLSEEKKESEAAG
jgi:hypothetical protein